MDVRAVRIRLGLTEQQMARVLDTDASSIRKMETAPHRKTYRPPAARMERLLVAYLAGYRPADWPAQEDAE